MINHDSATPKYIQLADELERQIHEGIFKADERLYSENELCRKYDVSRITVRQTLRLLETKGLIYTVHGKGTFVKMPVLSQDLPQIVSFSEMLSLKGLAGSTQLQSYLTPVQNEKAGQILQPAPEDKLCNLNLVARVQEAPVAFYQSFFREDLGEKMYKFAREMSDKGNPFTTYDAYEKLNIRLDRVEQSITAANLDKKLSELFGLPQGKALVVLESVFYDDQNRAVEYKVGYYRSDIYSFRLTRTL